MTTCNVVKALCGSYKSVRIKIVQDKMLNKRGHGEGGGGTGINNERTKEWKSWGCPNSFHLDLSGFVIQISYKYNQSPVDLKTRTENESTR